MHLPACEWCFVAWDPRAPASQFPGSPGGPPCLYTGAYVFPANTCSWVALEQGMPQDPCGQRGAQTWGSLYLAARHSLLDKQRHQLTRSLGPGLWQDSQPRVPLKLTSRLL